MWNVPDPMSAGGSSSWNTFFNTPSATFSGSNADWISDSDIGLWSGPPPPGCDMSNPNLWSGPHKDGSIAQSSMWSSNPSSSGWPNDLSSDRNPWSNDANLGQFWGGPPKTPDEFLGPKVLITWDVDASRVTLLMPCFASRKVLFLGNMVLSCTEDRM